MLDLDILSILHDPSSPHRSWNSLMLYEYKMTV